MTSHYDLLQTAQQALQPYGSWMASSQAPSAVALRTRLTAFRPYAIFAPAVALSLSLWTSPVQGQDLDQMMGPQLQFQAAMTVACGNLEKSNCAQVLPRIANKSVPLGLTLKPIISRGSVQSGTAVCKAVVNAAIGQQDAFDQVRRTTECAGTFDVVAKPLYPYFGYLVVARTNPADTLEELVSNVPEGKTLSVADGKVGSGGQVTFDQLLRTNATFKRVINTVDNDQSIALGKILDGSLDGYFVMDGPGSQLIDQIKTQVDAKGRRLYKFVEINPNDDFLGLKDWNGKNLYSTQVIPGGWGGKDTVSTNAIMIVNTAYANSDVGGKAVQILRNSADQAEAPIRADTRTPRNWVSDTPQN